MRDLARLLATPGREIAAVDLVSPTGATHHGDLGETIDAGRAAYKAAWLNCGPSSTGPTLPATLSGLTTSNSSGTRSSPS
jgi:hypothetical protein